MLCIVCSRLAASELKGQTQTSLLQPTSTTIVSGLPPSIWTPYSADPLQNHALWMHLNGIRRVPHTTPFCSVLYVPLHHSFTSTIAFDCSNSTHYLSVVIPCSTPSQDREHQRLQHPSTAVSFTLGSESWKLSFSDVNCQVASFPLAAGRRFLRC